jgi:hypothetical protein
MIAIVWCMCDHFTAMNARNGLRPAQQLAMCRTV